jgi:tight adherence protein C
MARFHKAADREKVATLIARARMEEQVTPDDIYALKALAVLVPLVYGSVLALGAGAPEMIIFGLMSVPVLFTLPAAWLNGRVRRYKEQLVRELPSFLNTLAVTVDAGLNLFPALQSVCSRRKGALAEEFRELLNGVEVKGLSAEEAFGLLAERCDVDELTLLASALEQALRRGGAGVSHVLQEQARTAWGARKKRAEELAQKASFKMFLPLLILVIPAIGIYMLGPTLILFWGEFTQM